MLKPAPTQTTQQRYAQLASTGFRFDLLPPDGALVDTADVVRRHQIMCRKTQTDWPLENLKRGVESGHIRLGLFVKSDKIIGIGYYSEMFDLPTYCNGMFVYGLQLDRVPDALEFAELTVAQLADEFGYTFVRFASPRKGWARTARNFWSFQYSVWEHQYGRR